MKLEDIDEMLRCWKAYDLGYTTLNKLDESATACLKMFGEEAWNTCRKEGDKVRTELCEYVNSRKQDVCRFFKCGDLPYDYLKTMVDEIVYLCERINEDVEWMENHPDMESAMTDAFEDSIKIHTGKLEQF